MKLSELRRVVLILLCSGPVVGACADSHRGDVVPEITVIGDTQIIQSAGAGRWSGTRRLVEELRIGAADGDPAYLFGDVRSLAVLSDGSLVVPDRQGPVLRIYSPDGRLLREIGREGEGPGEYRDLSGVQITRGEEIVVFDAQLRRVSFFDRQGMFLRSMNVDVGGSLTSNGLHQDTLGNLYLYGVGPSPRAAERMRLAGERALMSEAPGDLLQFHVKIAPSGEVLDTVLVPEWDLPRTPSFIIMTREGYAEPFVAELVYDLNHAGDLVVGRTTEDYRFDILTPGDRIRRVVREYEPVRLNREERAQWQALADYYGRNPRNASAGVEVPPVKPAFRNLEVDLDGRIWVNRYAEATKRNARPRPPEITSSRVLWFDVPTFDVFDPDGGFLGTVLTPANTEILLQKGDLLWGVEKDDLDVSYIVRYRMTWN